MPRSEGACARPALELLEVASSRALLPLIAGGGSKVPGGVCKQKSSDGCRPGAQQWTHLRGCGMGSGLEHGHSSAMWPALMTCAPACCVDSPAGEQMSSCFIFQAWRPALFHSCALLVGAPVRPQIEAATAAAHGANEDSQRPPSHSESGARRRTCMRCAATGRVIWLHFTALRIGGTLVAACFCEGLVDKS